MAANLRLLASGIALSIAAGCGPLNGNGTVECSLTGYTTEDTAQSVAIGRSGTTGLGAAQSFQLSSAAAPESIQIKLKKIGTFSSSSTYTITLTIRSDSSTTPGTPGTTVISAGTYLARDISSSGTYVTFTPSTSASLSASTTYWIVAEASYPASATNYIEWSGYDSGATGTGGYSAGSALYKDGTTGNWVNTNIGTDRDLLFIVGC